MSACPKCGSPVLPTDKFCNSCGFALTSAAPAGPTNPGPAPAFGAPPPFGAPPQQAPAPQHPGHQQQQQPYGGGGDPRHHEPGAGPYGAPPQPAQHGPYGPPPQQAAPLQQGHPPFGVDPTAPGGPGGYGADAYGAPPQHPAPYGQPQQQQQAYGQPPPQQQQGYAPGPGFGGPPPFGTPPNQAPQPSPGFGYGGPPPQQQQQPGAPAPFGAPPGAVQPLSPLTGPPGAMPAAQPQDSNAMVPQPGASNRSLRGFMVAFQANTQGEFWPLYGGRVTLGRANSGEVLDIQLPDPTISSKHAALLVDNVSGAIHVEDTGSTNGTYVNDEHLGFNGRRELRDGDRVRFGGFTTIVKIIGRV